MYCIAVKMKMLSTLIFIAMTWFCIPGNDICLKERQLLDGIKEGKGKIVDMLIEEGVNVNMLRYDRTPLMIAACYNHEEILIKLLEAGAMINEKNESNEYNACNNALMIATAAGSFECLKVLLEYGASINDKNRYGETSLIIAALYRELKCLELLLKHNACIDVKDNIGMTALMHASARGSTECMKVLINCDAKLDVIDDNGDDVLIKALSGHMDDNGDCSLFLIKAGCLISQENKEGKTPLMIAIWYYQIDVINELIARGVNVNYCNKNNVNALWIAADHKDVNLLKILINAEANPNIGRPALVNCVSQRHCSVACVKMLLEAGADINSDDIHCGTMMLRAAKVGNPEIVKIALNAGAKINISNKTFDFPYTYNEDCLMLLFACGEECDYFKYSKKAPESIIETRNDYSLQNMCRKIIRMKLIVINPK